MPDLNLFTFFLELAQSHNSKRAKPLTDRELASQTSTHMGEYFDAEVHEIDYASRARRIAYTASLGARHSIYWREFSKMKFQISQPGLALNVVGIGPGSEVIGILEGASLSSPLTLSDLEVEVRFLEKEKKWIPILESAMEKYCDETGVKIEVIECEGVDDFAEGVGMIGSYVLCELIPLGLLEQFITDARDTIGSETCYFLDLPTCKGAGSPFINQHLKALRPTPVKSSFDEDIASNLNLATVLSIERKAAGSLECQPVPPSPKVSSYEVVLQ
jgi:hypothetical protein